METSLETDSPSRRDPIGDSPIKEEGEDERKRGEVRVSNFMRYLTTASAVLCAPLEATIVRGRRFEKKAKHLRGRLDELLNIRSNEEEATKHGFMQSGRDSEQRFSSGEHRN